MLRPTLDAVLEIAKSALRVTDYFSTREAF